MSELLRRYLQTRRSLGDPPLFLPRHTRREAARAARRLARALERAGEREREPEASPGRARPGDSPGEEPVTGTGEAPVGGPDGGSDEVPGSGADRAGGEAGAGADGHDWRGGSPYVDEEGEALPADEGAARELQVAGEPALPSGQVDRLSREATEEEIGELPDLPTLRSVAESCVRCPLHESRNRVVFGEGSTGADVVCVGEAPGAVEDRTGRPFVGPAGKLLDRLLLAAGFRRGEVFICNVLKCRPPGNRNPKPGEIDRCSPYLHRQLDLLDPRVVVAFGSFASQTLLDVNESIGRLRERTHLYRGFPLVVTYHPAALLRNPKWTRPTWEDLQQVRRIVDGEASPEPADTMNLQRDVFAQDG